MNIKLFLLFVVFNAAVLVLVSFRSSLLPSSAPPTGTGTADAALEDQWQTYTATKSGPPSVNATIDDATEAGTPAGLTGLTPRPKAAATVSATGDDWRGGSGLKAVPAEVAGEAQPAPMAPDDGWEKLQAQQAKGADTLDLAGTVEPIADRPKA